ncbi:MAG TPA: transketolase C-terminal domain-containing protein, partial [Candidatus Paceibacterota bacterium]
AYIRLAREKTPVITTDSTPFKIGRAEVYWTTDNPKAGIIATGALLHKALLAAKELSDKDIEVEVMNLSTIKPLDKEAILEFAKRCKKIVTVEEHQRAGGMGSAVAEFLIQNYPVPMEILGIDDQFGQSGTPEELIEHFGLDKDSIIKAARKILKR